MAQIKIITANDMQDTVSSTSALPVKSSVLYNVLGGKLDKKGYASSLENNVATIVKKGTTESPSYEVDFVAIPAAANADWNQTDTSKVDYIKNKPFKAIGTGLTVTAGVLSANTQFEFKIFTALPTAGPEYKQTIALVLQTGETEKYNEYACVNTGTTEAPVWKWEQIGSTEFKLTITQDATGIKINDTVLQASTDSQTGLMSAADHVTLTGAQAKANIVTAFQTTTEDTKYPSEKLVKDNLDLKQDVANLVTTIAVPASASDTKYPSEKSVSTALAGKQDVADKVTSWSATTSDAKYPSEKLVKDSIDTKIAFATGSTSTSFTIGKDANGYFIEE